MRFIMSADPQNVKSEPPHSGRSHLTARGRLLSFAGANRSKQAYQVGDEHVPQFVLYVGMLGEIYRIAQRFTATRRKQIFPAAQDP
jgi:hypothetical protein